MRVRHEKNHEGLRCLNSKFLTSAQSLTASSWRVRTSAASPGRVDESAACTSQVYVVWTSTFSGWFATNKLNRIGQRTELCATPARTA